jgi:hypothetical protein
MFPKQGDETCGTRMMITNEMMPMDASFLMRAKERSNLQIRAALCLDLLEPPNRLQVELDLLVFFFPAISQLIIRSMIRGAARADVEN